MDRYVSRIPHPKTASAPVLLYISDDTTSHLP